MSIQVCERTQGQETCPLHPGHKIDTICKTCGILVCHECMTSNDHEEHNFKKISKCLDEPKISIDKYLTNIGKTLLAAVDRELNFVERQRNDSKQKHATNVQSIEDQGKSCKTEIDSATESMVVQMKKQLHEVIEILDNHKQVLESLRKYLMKERKDCQKVLQTGSSNILKFDVGNAVKDKADIIQIPQHPKIPDLGQYTNKCGNSEALIKELLGTVQALNYQPSLAHESTECSTRYTASVDPSVLASPTKPEHKRVRYQSVPTSECKTAHDQTLPDGKTAHDQTLPDCKTAHDHSVPDGKTAHDHSVPDGKTAHKYSAITTQTTFQIEDPHYIQITPIAEDFAWALLTTPSCLNNQLHLLDRNIGQRLRDIQTESNFQALSVHPMKRSLYGSFPEDKSIRIIDTVSAATTVVVQCDSKPERIKVTKDKEVLVATLNCPNLVYRYKLTGALVHKSPEKYKVNDIDQCSKTNRVAVCNSFMHILQMLHNSTVTILIAKLL